MTQRSSADVGFLLIGGRSVLGSITTITEEHSRITEDNTPLGVASDTWGDVGVSNFMLVQEGFYDEAVGGYNEALGLANPQVLLYAPDGNVLGRDLVAASGVRAKYSRLPARGALHKARAGYKAALGPEWPSSAKIQAALAAYAVTPGPTSLGVIDWLASSVLGGAIYITVPALTLSGATSLKVVARHSSDNFGADDTVLDTFTLVTTANATERRVIASGVTIKRYTKFTYEWPGAPTTPSGTFAAGLGRK